MVLAHEPAPLRLAYDLAEEFTGEVLLEETLAVLGEGGVVEDGVADVEAQEPLEEEVVLEPLAELALGADRIQRDEEARFDELLGRDGVAAAGSIHRRQLWREHVEEVIDDGAYPPDRMPLGNELVGRHSKKHPRLLFDTSAHMTLPAAHRLTDHMLMLYQAGRRFSTPC